ncbi:hypothetical protein KIN20_010458 [Parelaphostrongylus tenuis]|uniref:Uncharacterized protein n=1 Tax=Parelaphostrongylus tenuis TaxID=148309 RepID=A0AAD5MQP5_PARTN|nr:hypothetical protein KIN20_010458 [Parelaphostrongylus tenuis]
MRGTHYHGERKMTMEEAIFEKVAQPPRLFRETSKDLHPSSTKSEAFDAQDDKEAWDQPVRPQHSQKYGEEVIIVDSLLNNPESIED